MKENYDVCLCSKGEVTDLLNDFHYLSKISVTFKSGFNVALKHKGVVVGACIFTGFPVPELATGCFGLDRKEQKGLWELSRFVLDPSHQSKEHNLSTWFMARAIKKIKKEQTVSAVLSYADDDHHSGIIYAASNFKYYGLASAKKDFWIKQEDGSYKKHSRGKTKGIAGEWRPRSRKHRFLLVFDKVLRCNWVEEKWQNKKESNDD
mgnify:FL=1|jgi:hypothetical protein|tara:strand:+ start:42 stop:659 length:618 start_codon:yes stop_codon:yes gene_type:complete